MQSDWILLAGATPEHEPEHGQRDDQKKYHPPRTEERTACLGRCHARATPAARAASMRLDMAWSFGARCLADR